MPTPGALPAGWGKRCLAFVIDQVAAALLGGAFVAAGLPAVLTPDAGRGSAGLVLAGAALLVVLGLVQWWYLGTRGVTLGKRLVGLRLVDAVTGRPVGMGRALVRALVPGLAGVVPVVGTLAVWASSFADSSGLRRGWHDKAGGAVLLDVVVGVDPTTAARVTTADASRRLDSVLRAAVPSDGPARLVPLGVAAPAGASPAAPAPTSGAPRSGVPVPAVPVPAVPVPAVPVPAVPVPVVRDARVAPVPGASPTSTVAPSPASPSPAERLVTGVPAPLARPDLPEVATGAVRGDTDPSRRTAAEEEAARPVRRVVPSSHEVLTSVPFPGAPVDEDVESTRLRPARGKVPELRGDGAEVTVELTDGQRVTFGGSALVGRNPSPRPGEEECRLIRVADPGRSVSKTHLLLGVDRAGLWVKDRDSTNGTVVTLADGQQILCGAEQQVRIPPGASVAFGDYGLSVATVDVH